MENISIPDELNEYEYDGLIKINDAEKLENAFYFRKIDKVVYPYFNYELYSKLYNVNLNDCDLFVRPRKITSFAEYSSNSLLNEERMFGMPFDKNNFRKILKKEYGEFRYQFFEEKDLLIERLFFIPLDRLEYYVEPNEGNLISLSLEDVIDFDKIENMNLEDRYYTTSDGRHFVKHRYLHAIFDRDTANVVHLDMSWFIYFDDNIKIRKNFKLKDRRVRADKKIKIFKIDAKPGNYLPFEMFQTIAGSAMDGNRNPEIYRFFSGE